MQILLLLVALMGQTLNISKMGNQRVLERDIYIMVVLWWVLVSEKSGENVEFVAIFASEVRIWIEVKVVDVNMACSWTSCTGGAIFTQSLEVKISAILI